MKFGRKTTAALGCLVGAAVFAVSAFADIAVGSGYAGAKDALKHTAATLVDGVDSFSADMSANLTFDGRVLDGVQATMKYDVAGNRMEERNQASGTDQHSGYSYRDSEKYVNLYEKGGEEEYYVNYRESDDSDRLLENPFEDEVAADVETVIDAFVGTLKDVVQMEELDGQKVYTVAMSGTEIPALPNTLASVGMKYSFFDEYQSERYQIPQLVSDIYVSEVTGKMVTDMDDVIESALGRMVVTGKDKGGADHTMVIEVSGTIYDVNATTVAEPDLTGAEVIESDGYSDVTPFVGLFKADIAEWNGSAYVKTGERTLELYADGDDRLAGTYFDGEASYDISGGYEKDYYELVLTYEKDGQPVTCTLHRVDDAQVISFADHVRISEDGYSTFYSDDTINCYMVRVLD